ncbi:hypothetical protein GeomeDRAFT_2529 [Geobacter metallireducens RCH3]|uniref:Lipoprotein n=1 Tax=Geobacter metallireducens (strain ATCC 53774 / DSM 7210 / GS-15) TaxID=269799 RepID=Q39Q07_GEOMG|nr:DUF6448 family protein [Geobacter metallireducens]ABB33667.1 hypothetical protein Gmet_3458 [Geobacter metallireducens GS-15]EHP85363.1 hypothetical protein GeomeDRAFT_2529 [Geobacter metallireducens RCH3]
MNTKNILSIKTAGIAAAIALSLALPQFASAHCDTLDGPVVQDARKAIEAKDITPVLKWVRPTDEHTVKSAFNAVLAAKGKNAEAAETRFFTTLVKVHRAGEGAPFTGLKPAGAVEPAVAEADKALVGGSADALVKLVSDDVAAGIRKRYEHAAETYRHKDESVAQGREFVKAYVEFTHYVERLHTDATGAGAHGEHGGDPHAEQHGGAGHSPVGHGAAEH